MTVYFILLAVGGRRTPLKLDVGYRGARYYCSRFFDSIHCAMY
jgi:hypothetical protein